MFRDEGKPQLTRLWWLFTVALLIHGVIDPGLTFVLITSTDLVRELNPLIRWGLNEGIGMLVLLHLPLYVVAIAIFAGITKLMQLVSDQEAK